MCGGWALGPAWVQIYSAFISQVTLDWRMGFLAAGFSHLKNRDSDSSLLPRADEVS